MNIETIAQLISGDGFTSVHTKLARKIGFAEAGMYQIILSKYSYYASLGQLAIIEGKKCFYLTNGDLEERGFGPGELKTLKVKLQKLGLVDWFVKGIPPKTFFYLPEDSAQKIVVLLQETPQKPLEMPIGHFEPINRTILTNQWDDFDLTYKDEMNESSSIPVSVDLFELEGFEPTEMYSQTISKNCPDMDTLAIETELLKFKTYFADHPPLKNPDMKFLNWCQNVNNDYKKRKDTAKTIERELDLKDQRVNEFHEKKMENISKIGTQNNFKSPYQSPTNPSQQPASFDQHPQIAEIKSTSPPVTKEQAERNLQRIADMKQSLRNNRQNYFGSVENPQQTFNLATR